MVRLVAYNKNPNIGIIGRANDKTVVLPFSCPKNFASMVSRDLGVEVIHTNVAGTFLVGAMIAMNNHGMVVPRSVYESEMKRMSKLNINIEVIEDRLTALGNLILANDNGAIVSRLFSKKAIKDIEDILGCEAVQGEICGFKTVGSVGIATSKGALVHPMVNNEELELIRDVLKVEVDIGTVNRGVGFVRTGIIVNTKGLLVGNETTGPEINRIEDSLGVYG